MFQIHHLLLKEREKPFRPTKIKLLAWGIQRFNPPLTRPYIDYATDEYKTITNAEVAKMRTKLFKEADTLGLKGLDKGKYINQACNQFKADRESEAIKDPLLKQRVSEL